MTPSHGTLRHNSAYPSFLGQLMLISQHAVSDNLLVEGDVFVFVVAVFTAVR